MTLTITDDDKGTITASFGGQIVRTWSYRIEVADMRRLSMSLAREFAEGWYLALLHRNKSH